MGEPAQNLDAENTDTTATPEQDVRDPGVDNSTTEAANTTTTTAEPTQAGKEGHSDTADWRAGIEDPKLRDFAGRFTTPGDLAKTALEFRQKLSNAIARPADDASDEEWAEFRQKIGVPSSADDYEIELPEELPFQADAEEFVTDIKSFADVMHKAGAPQEAVAAAVNWYLEKGTNAEQNLEKTYQTSFDEGTKALKTEWGNEYDANVETANRAVRQYIGDGDWVQRATVDGKPILNNPEFIKVMATIGRRIGEDGLHAAMTDDERQTTEQKMNSLTDQAHSAMNSGNRAEANRLFAERDRLAKQYYGTE